MGITTSTKIIPLFSAGHRGRKDKGNTGTIETRPPEKEPGQMDRIDRFDESRMHLEAFLDGIYNTALTANSIDINANTILVFCSMAQDKVKEMDKVFREITEEGGIT